MHRFHQHRHHHEARGRHPFGWEGHGLHGLRPGRRERSTRVFGQGDLRLLLLKLIAEKPRHGYELIKAVEDGVGGAYSPSPGVVYPTLALLEDLGYASVAEAEGGNYHPLHAYMAALARPYSGEGLDPAWLEPAPREPRLGVELLSCSS